MKKVYSLLFFWLLIAIGFTYAQPNPNPKILQVFQENFETVPWLNFTSSTSFPGTKAVPWKDTTLVAKDGIRSAFSRYPDTAFLNQTQNLQAGTLNNRYINELVTNSFSTLGNKKVWLNFSHICKVRFSDSTRMFYSLDNGVTWVRITTFNSVYSTKGRVDSASAFAEPILNNRTFSFGEASYGALWGPGNGNFTINNSMWRNECFDISFFAKNQPNVKLKFEFEFKRQTTLFPYVNGGWYIDSLRIDKALDEVEPPFFTHTPVTGTFYTLPPININAAITDTSGVASARFIYRQKLGEQATTWEGSKTLPLTRGNVIPFGNQFSITLDTSKGFWDGDSVCYYLGANDSTVFPNDTVFFNNSNNPRPPRDSSWCFKLGGPPQISFQAPFVQGRVFSNGPFLIRAQVTDPSGIDSATLWYRVGINGTPIPIGMVESLGIPNNYDATIPQLNVGDTVYYYVFAQDKSLRLNSAIFPTNGFNLSRAYIIAQENLFPYFNNFEGNNPTFGWTVSTLTPANSAGWQFGSPQPSKSAFLPLPSGNHAWVTDTLNNYADNANWILMSPIFNFNNVQNAVLGFTQNRRINEGNPNPTIGQGDGFTVQYSLNPENATPSWTTLGTGINDINGVNWYNKNNITVNNTPGFDGNVAAWTVSQYRLGALNNQQNVRFRFVLRSNSSLNDLGVALDNVSLQLAEPVDLAAIQIVSPTVEMRGGATSDSVIVVIRNFGSTTISNIPVKVSVNGTVSSSMVWNGTLLPSTSATIKLPPFVAPVGNFTLCAYTDTVTDGDRSNDTSCVILFGVPTYTVPYSDNFDSLNTDWRSRAQNSNGDLQFFRGTPTKTFINNPPSMPNAWVTQLTGLTNPGQFSAVYSPFFDFSSAFNYRIRLKINTRLGVNQGMRILYSLDNQSWTPINNSLNAVDTNWYNGSANFPLNILGSQQLGVQPAWTDTTIGWVNASLKLPDTLDLISSPVRFKIEMTTGNAAREGAAFDDFVIEPPVGGNIGIISIDQPLVSPTRLKTVNPVVVTIKNYGLDTIYAYSINYRIRQGLNVVTPYAPMLVNKKLAPAQIDTVHLLPLYSYFVGNHTLEAYTLLPGDVAKANDTSRITILGLPRFEASALVRTNPKDFACLLLGNNTVSFRIRNNGHYTIDSLQASYVKTQTGVTVTETFRNLNLLTDSTATLTFSTPVNIALGPNTLNFTVSFAGDTIPNNNSTTSTFYGIPNDTTIFQTTFDRTQAIESSKWCFENNVNGVTRVSPVSTYNNSRYSLEMSAFNSSAQGWTDTDTTNAFNPNVNEDYLTRAVVRILGEPTEENLYASFRMFPFSIGSTQGFLRVLCNGQQIGRVYQSGNFNTFDTLDFPLIGAYVPGSPFTFEIQVSCKYNSLSNNTNRQAFFIDNFKIYDRPQNSAGSANIATIPALVTSSNPIRINATIVNSGYRPLSTVGARLWINGNLHQTSFFTPPTPIPFKGRFDGLFSNPITLPAGNNNICITVFNPNGVNDQFPLDDSLCKTVIALPTYTDTAYCNNFDNNSNDFRGLNTFTYLDNRISWASGDPTKPFLSAPNSGNKAWVTRLDSSYYNNDSSSLYTPLYTIEKDSCYLLKFTHKFKTENLWDGGNVEYSLDGGVTWTILGSENSPNWYNTPHIFGLWDYRVTPPVEGPGFSGFSQTWINSQHYFNANVNGNVQFRFRFQSDPSVNDEGWMIDDFCFEPQTGVNCIVLSSPTLNEDKFTLDQNYPNPTESSQITTITYNLPTAGKVSYSLFDISGKMVQQQNFGHQLSGKQSFSVNTAGLNAGIYFYSVIFNDIRLTKKMVIVK